MPKEVFDFAATIEAETDKAWLLDHGGKTPAWFPKSLTEDNGDGTFTAPVWLCSEKKVPGC